VWGICVRELGYYGGCLGVSVCHEDL